MARASIVLLAFGIAHLSAAPVDSSAPVDSKEFFWGVANSSFQVEGSPADSDWKRWTNTVGRIRDQADASQATDFWNRYKEDFRLARFLGANSFRMSIAWERIQRGPNEWDEAALRHYEEMISAMRSFELEPVVTLHHFVTPGWLYDQGGLLAEDFSDHFKAYAKKVMGRLSQPPFGVKYWMTFNEPMVVVRGSFIEGTAPPGRKQDFKAAALGLANMAQGHLKAYDWAKKKFPSIQIGIAQHWRRFEASSRGPMDSFSTWLVDWIFNRQFVDAVTGGEVFFFIPPALPVWRNYTSSFDTPLDYLGINYYGRTITSFMMKPPFIAIAEGPGTKTDIGWEIHPDGLREVLIEAADYGLPLLVSENGLADKNDRWRSKFLKDHIGEVMQAKEEVEIFGYLHWSLTDNFEWAEGLEPRFGLVEVDYEALSKTPRPSFYTYKRIIEDLKR